MQSVSRRRLAFISERVYLSLSLCLIVALSVLNGSAIAQSTHSGTGAIPYSGGVAFRVWAPNASGVAVAGSFNSWSASANTLVGEGGGFWSVDVSGAAVGDQYKFVITNGTTTLWKVDPWARSVTNSVGNSVVYDDNAYNWGSSSFTTPPWNEMVVYEMHVGTFIS